MFALLGPGILILKVLYWVGAKFISLFSSPAARYSTDVTALGRIGKLAVKRKTPEVATEMAHLTAHLQGSPFSPFRMALIIVLIVFVWGGVGWFIVGPHYKRQRDEARSSWEKACVEDDKRAVCQQVLAFANRENEWRMALADRDARIVREQKKYTDELAKLQVTIRGENERAARAVARIKKANDNAKKSTTQLGLAPDDYRGIVRELFEPASVPSGDSSSAGGSGNMGAGVLPGTGADQPSTNEPGTADAANEPAVGR